MAAVKQQLAVTSRGAGTRVAAAGRGVECVRAAVRVRQRVRIWRGDDDAAGELACDAGGGAGGGAASAAVAVGGGACGLRGGVPVPPDAAAAAGGGLLGVLVRRQRPVRGRGAAAEGPFASLSHAVVLVYMQSLRDNGVELVVLVSSFVALQLGILTRTPRRPFWWR